MSEKKQKVADLPQDEKDALINEAKELKIRGMYETFNVDTLKTKIAEARGNELTADADAPAQQKAIQADNADSETDNETATETGDETAVETATETAENTDANVADKKEEEKSKTPKVTKAKGKAYINEKPAKSNAKKKLCHICRSAVVNGVCTGCGFELHK